MSDLIPGEGFRFRRVTGEVFSFCVLVDAPGVDRCVLCPFPTSFMFHQVTMCRNVVYTINMGRQGS